MAQAPGLVEDMLVGDIAAGCFVCANVPPVVQLALASQQLTPQPIPIGMTCQRIELAADEGSTSEVSCRQERQDMK